MKLHFTNDWLRSQIDLDADIECDAGVPVHDTSPLERFLQSKLNQQTGEPAPEQKMAVLHVLVHQLRRRDNLTVSQLAERIRVEAAELETIERDRDYVPRPRTLHMLASYMKVSTQAVQSLTSDAIARNDNVTEAALKFAASSKDLSSLTSAERRGLNNFVKFLADYKSE
jgi:transcriptional regulator with XRE-family HTH domain